MYAADKVDDLFLTRELIFVRLSKLNLPLSVCVPVVELNTHKLIHTNPAYTYAQHHKPTNPRLAAPLPADRRSLRS